MSFDFASVAAPFRMQPGLRRMAPGAPHLTPSLPGSRPLREKLAVLQAHWRDALMTTPGFDAVPALASLIDRAASEHPHALTHDPANGGCSARLLGWTVRGDVVVEQAGAVPEVGACLGALPGGWRLAALLCLAFREDFAVVDARTGCIPWLAVCLPSHWAPRDKLGLHFAQVHAPVADNQRLIAASAQLLRLVTTGPAWERFVWTVAGHPRLHAHPERVDPAPWPADADADGIAATAYWRTEHQTFIPVRHAELQQAVFTIGVDVQPLAQAIATAGQAAALHAALASMSPAVLRYRGLTAARDRLLEWLQRRAR